MAKRDSFLLRIDPKVLAAIRKWAEDEMRSMNGQIEYLLSNCVRQAGRAESNDSKSTNSEEDTNTDSAQDEAE